MTIDLKALDHRIDSAYADGGQSAEELVESYCDAIVGEFRDSREARELTSPAERAGSWAFHLVHHGISHLGVGLSAMTPADLWEILGDIFPRQISILDPAHADTIIPEIRAFLRFLKREHRLHGADALLSTLDRLEPGYSQRMLDPVNFGPAKSFVMAGQRAGYDMTDEAQAQQFMLEYNLARASSPPPFSGLAEPDASLRIGRSKEGAAKRKNKRKQQRAGRKASRKRK
jgi:hypothetical protein